MPLLDADDPVVIPSVGGRPPVTIERRDLCGIIQPRMSEIFHMVKEKVEKKGYLQSLGRGVVLTDAASLLPGTVDLVQEIFGLPGRIGKPGNFGGLKEEYQKAEYATAVGLVLYGEKETKLGISERFSRERGVGLLSGLKHWVKNFFD